MGVTHQNIGCVLVAISSSTFFNSVYGKSVNVKKIGFSHEVFLLKGNPTKILLRALAQVFGLASNVLCQAR
jgi:NifU-like protein involved in Fe-S cluster formation